VRVIVVTALLLVAACAAATPTRPLGPGEQWVPVANWKAGPFGPELLCAGTGWVPPGALHGSANDPRLVWVTRGAGTRRLEVGWPLGYSARFTPQLELLDAAGSVVGHEGTAVGGGCLTADADVWSVELAN
jgi:hypothetical protein